MISYLEKFTREEDLPRRCTDSFNCRFLSCVSAFYKHPSRASQFFLCNKIFRYIPSHLRTKLFPALFPNFGFEEEISCQLVING